VIRYRDYRRIEIDNNAAKRTVALGCKHDLYAGCHDGGVQAAAIFSLIG